MPGLDLYQRGHRRPCEPAAWERSFSPTPPFSYLDYRGLREQNHTLAGILAYHHDWITLTGGAQPEHAYISNVSANYFDVPGIKPVLGRFFLPEEESRPVPNVVLSYSLWKTRYAEDPAIVGKSIEIARHPVTVIGVAPEGAVGAMPGIRERDARLIGIGRRDVACPGTFPSLTCVNALSARRF